MPQCAVVNCNNTHRKTKGGSVRYHRFPGDGETRARWIQACGRHVQNCATARVCSRHFSDFSYERDVQHELLGLPTRCRLRKGSVPDKNLPPEALEEHPPVDSAIAVLLAVGLIPNNARSDGKNSGGLPFDLNKMHVMEDVREGCDTQPSSPGHADQRPEMEVDTCTENGISHDLPENAKETSEVPPEAEVKPNGKLNEENQESEVQENGTLQEPDPQVKEYDADRTAEDSASNDSSCTNKKRKSDASEKSSKKFRSDLDECFNLRDRILTDYISNANCSSVDQYQACADQIIAEIRTLNELAKEKEKEWNNIIHLKKFKEEALLRIQREKQILQMSSDGCDGADLAENCLDERQNLHSPNKQSLLKQRYMNNHSGKVEVTRHRHILPKIQNSYDVNGQNDYKQLKQRNVVDVRSIIADYRQRHPEAVPRRGRRIRSVLNSAGDNKVSSSSVLNLSNLALGSGAQVRQNLSAVGIDVNSELGILLSQIENGSRQDGYRSQSGLNSNQQDITSFKDILVQFAKMSQSERQELMQNKSKVAPPPPYPEVTVHPVTTAAPQQHTSSLLHGILTKAQTKNDSKSTFSPTLARLLTAPERAAAASISQANSPTSSLMHGGNVSISEILSSSKARNEITITPVATQYDVSPKGKSAHIDEEEAEDSADRLVIDETVEMMENRTRSNDCTNTQDNNSDNDEVPQCQGCNQKAAQFVCAGCGNQWYCSRDCQVAAWDEHSEVCSG